jgi:gliding motility-associated-like protein
MVNDVFQPIGAAIESYELTIYNRWGEAVYVGNAAWNGRQNNKEAPVDVYIYNVNIRICGDVKDFSGDLTLIR